MAGSSSNFGAEEWPRAGISGIRCGLGRSCAMIRATSSAENVGCGGAPAGGTGGAAGGATGGFRGMGILLPAGGDTPWSTGATGGCVIDVVGVQMAQRRGNETGAV